MRRALAVAIGLSVLRGSVGWAADPPEIKPLRAKYQATVKQLETSAGGYSASIAPADASSKATLKVTWFAPDAADVESSNQDVQFIRVAEIWSNLGVQTGEYLFDEKGALAFHYTQVSSGGGKLEAIRMWFEAGVLLHVQEGQKPIQVPTSAHQVAAGRAKAEASRLVGVYRALRSTKVELP